MIVIGIMVIVMSMGVPMVYRIWHKAPMRHAVSDVLEVCSNARAQAILRGTMTEIVFHPKERRLEIVGAGAAQSSAALQAGGQGEHPEMGPPPAPGSGLSAQLSEDLVIEMLDVNLSEYKD